MDRIRAQEITMEDFDSADADIDTLHTFPLRVQQQAISRVLADWKVPKEDIQRAVPLIAHEVRPSRPFTARPEISNTSSKTVRKIANCFVHTEQRPDSRRGRRVELDFNVMNRLVTEAVSEIQAAKFDVSEEFVSADDVRDMIERLPYDDRFTVRDELVRCLEHDDPAQVLSELTTSRASGVLAGPSAAPTRGGGAPGPLLRDADYRRIERYVQDFVRRDATTRTSERDEDIIRVLAKLPGRQDRAPERDEEEEFIPLGSGEMPTFARRERERAPERIRGRRLDDSIRTELADARINIDDPDSGYGPGVAKAALADYLRTHAPESVSELTITQAAERIYRADAARDAGVDSDALDQLADFLPTPQALSDSARKAAMKVDKLFSENKLQRRESRDLYRNLSRAMFGTGLRGDPPAAILPLLQRATQFVLERNNFVDEIQTAADLRAYARRSSAPDSVLNDNELLATLGERIYEYAQPGNVMRNRDIIAELEGHPTPEPEPQYRSAATRLQDGAKRVVEKARKRNDDIGQLTERRIEARDLDDDALDARIAELEAKYANKLKRS